MHAVKSRSVHSLSGFSDALLRYAPFLPPAERALIEQVFGRGVPITALARVHGKKPEAVQRRVRVLIARLTDPRVARVLGLCRHWDESRRAVALRWWLAGRSQPRIAAELGLSLYEVRRHLLAVRALIEEGGVGDQESGVMTRNS